MPSLSLLIAFEPTHSLRVSERTVVHPDALSVVSLDRASLTGQYAEILIQRFLKQYQGVPEMMAIVHPWGLQFVYGIQFVENSNTLSVFGLSRTWPHIGCASCARAFPNFTNPCPQCCTNSPCVNDGTWMPHDGLIRDYRNPPPQAVIPLQTLRNISARLAQKQEKGNGHVRLFR